jgi:hypothetical protein
MQWNTLLYRVVGYGVVQVISSLVTIPSLENSRRNPYSHHYHRHHSHSRSHSYSHSHSYYYHPHRHSLARTRPYTCPYSSVQWSSSLLW